MNIHIWNERTRLTPVEPLKPRFWVNSEMCLHFSRLC